MKYIIEADERSELVQVISVMPNGTVYTNERGIDELEELNSDYINKYYGSLQDEAYQRGVEDGQNETWEAARKISTLESDGGYSWKEMKSIFGTDSVCEIHMRYTAAEAISKIKAYEEKQKADDKIAVGDEVAFHHDDGRPDTVVVVTYIGQNGFIDGMDGRGTQYALKNPAKWTKTGRHFDIDKILKEMNDES